jgi:hypothetical protein
MKVIFFCLLFVLFATLGAEGQDTHYWTQQYGSRSALMGGAVVGGTKDNTSVVYNPGVLGFVDTGSISINANAYWVQNIRIRNAIGQQADFKSSSIGSVPLLLSGMIKTKSARWKIGYAIVHPVDFNFKATARIDGDYPIVDDAQSPGDEAFIGQESILSSISETTVALGVSRKLSEHWSVGISNLFTARSASYLRATLSRFFLNDPDSTLVTSTVLESFSYFHLRYAAKIGLAYRNGPIGAGLTFTTPGVKIIGDGTVGADLTASNISLNNQPRMDVLADDRQTKLKSVFRSPLSASAGVNIRLRGSLIAVSAQYFASEDIYDILRGNPSAFVRPASVYGALGAADFLRVKTGARQVTNIAVAYEYHPETDLTLHLSIRNDMSYFDKDLVNAVGIKPDLTTWNIYHLTAGTTIRRGRSGISAGLLFSTGTDPRHDEPGNLSNPSQNNFLQGAYSIAKATYSSFGILIGYTYNFRKD